VVQGILFEVRDLSRLGWDSGVLDEDSPQILSKPTYFLPLGKDTFPYFRSTIGIFIQAAVQTSSPAEKRKFTRVGLGRFHDKQPVIPFSNFFNNWIDFPWPVGFEEEILII